MNRRVLVIDDSADIHFKIRWILQGQPIDLIEATSGNSGLELANAAPPDLILLDVDMPAPDGFEVCRMLKSREATSAVPIIFLTGASSTEQKIRGLGLGAVDYITKPFDAAELKARVEAALRTKTMIDRMGRLAMLDALTGLWNRAYFEECITVEMSRARRTGEILSCTIADIDHFKAINDGHGHAAGDHVLRNVGRILTDGMRLDDKLARIGGEEFAILSVSTPAEGAVILAERLRGLIQNAEFFYNNVPIRATCSFGVADIAHDPHMNANQLFEIADQALYRAKREGRNRVIAGHGELAAHQFAAPGFQPAGGRVSFPA
jgi:two-component system cell cycle response regulator